MAAIQFGVQLYSVRDECQKDLPATLKTLREIGYDAVEPWGFDGSKIEWRGLPAKDVRKMFDDNGLTCCGIHLATKALLADNLDRTIEMNQILGNRYLIIAADKEHMSSEAGIAELAGILTLAATKLKPLGMFAGYHAHGFDFADLAGRTPWDILFSTTPADVVMQLDIGNCAEGGGDPVAVLRKFPGRARSVHLKEYGAPVIGEGKADWAEILRLCETEHKTEWYVVEEERTGVGFDDVRDSLNNLRKMGK